MNPPINTNGETKKQVDISRPTLRIVRQSSHEQPEIVPEKKNVPDKALCRPLISSLLRLADDVDFQVETITKF